MVRKGERVIRKYWEITRVYLDYDQEKGVPVPLILKLREINRFFPPFLKVYFYSNL